MRLQRTIIDEPLAATLQDKHPRNGSQHLIQLVTIRHTEHGVDA